MSPSDFYVKKMYEKFEFIATWLPNAKLCLGDVGELNGCNFKRLFNIKDKELTFNVRNSNNGVNFSYTCRANLNIQNAEKTGLDQIGKAEVVISFNSEGSFVFEANECLITEIENKIELGEQIKKIYKNNKNDWNENWVIIDTLVQANSSTIFISTEKDSELSLLSKFNLPQMKLADANLNLNVKTERGQVMKIIANAGLTPLFKSSKIKRTFLDRLTRNRDNPMFGGDIIERNVQYYQDNDIWENVNII